MVTHRVCLGETQQETVRSSHTRDYTGLHFGSQGHASGQEELTPTVPSSGRIVLRENQALLLRLGLGLTPQGLSPSTQTSGKLVGRKESSFQMKKR